MDFNQIVAPNIKFGQLKLAKAHFKRSAGYTDVYNASETVALQLV